MIAVSIIFINLLFYFIIIPLVKMIGFYRKHREEDHNCKLIVICLMLDMIVLPILIGANFKETNKGAYDGKHTDFDADWYTEIGRQIVTTMIFFTFQPIIDFIIAFTKLNGTRCFKKCFVYKNESEIKRDTLTYMDMNAGPEYPYYYQTSKTITTVIICLLFGGSMPMLYLIGIIALLIQYLSDRLILAYFYRLPPMYTDRLTQSMLKIVSVMPVFSLSILFW